MVDDEEMVLTMSEMVLKSRSKLTKSAERMLGLMRADMTSAYLLGLLNQGDEHRVCLVQIWPKLCGLTIAV